MNKLHYLCTFGTQPTLTQVPPSLEHSTKATCAPYPAARRADATPNSYPNHNFQDKIL